MPVWGGLRDGLMVANAQYNRTYIETALAEETGKKRFLGPQPKASNPGGASVPPLTAEQDEALDLVAAIAEESCLQQRFELGDLQLSSK